MMNPAQPSPPSPGFGIQRGGLHIETMLFRGGLAVAAILMGFVIVQVLGPLLPIGMAQFAVVPIVGLTALLAGMLPAVAVVVAITGIEWARLGLSLESSAPVSPEALILFVALSATQIALVVRMHGGTRSSRMDAAKARAVARRQALLFTELQHRIANNLTVIGALLARRGRELTDPGARRALEEAAARLGVAARLSRRLHDPARQELDLATLLREMIPEILSIAGAERRLVVDVDTEQVVIPAARAIPLALVAVELLSNAIEHGFPDSEGGTLEIRLERTGEATARLLVRHDGIALPPGFRLSQARSLGLTVASQLAETAGADLVIIQDRGVVSCLTFPVLDTGDRSRTEPGLILP